jgi:hypothetical protein
MQQGGWTRRTSWHSDSCTVSGHEPGHGPASPPSNRVLPRRPQMALTKATGEPAASCTAPGIPATPCTSRSKNLAAQSPSSKINTETVRHRLTHTLLRWCLHVGHCHPLLWLRDGTHPLAARTSEPRPLAQVRQIRSAAPVGAKTWAGRQAGLKTARAAPADSDVRPGPRPRTVRLHQVKTTEAGPEADQQGREALSTSSPPNMSV